MALPATRQQYIDYCLRKLGDPVIEINVDEDQIQDRIDEAFLYYREYHSDASVRTFLKHLVTSDDVTNEYISLSTDILFVSKVFPISSGLTGRGMFDIKYQMMLNDMSSMIHFAGDLAYYEQMQQYLSLLDMKLNGQPQVQFSRRENRLYIHGDFADGDIIAGDYIIAEVYTQLNPTTNTSIWADMWLLEYGTALIKQQWGQNLIKFEGMQLPGGVIINGRQLYDDATTEIQQLRENIRMEHEMPADFFVG
tara:strand:- start:56 stop:808 length:753 start_codon:yes stop_codon:yes gene_type:complete